MPTVYRVENEKGEGPYREAETIKAFGFPDGTNPLNRPLPFEDLRLAESCSIYKMFDTPGMVFGFESLDSLYNWFDPDSLAKLAKLGELGFGVSEYQAETVYFGDSQVIFHKDSLPTQVCR